MNGEIFSTLQKAKVAIEGWRGHENTNTVRPHSSLGSPPDRAKACLATMANTAGSLGLASHVEDSAF
jgi:hypothetical protein